MFMWPNWSAGGCNKAHVEMKAANHRRKGLGPVRQEKNHSRKLNNSYFL